MKRILVTGGAGYIGSFTVRALKEAGYETVVFDNFSSGHREAIAGVPFVKGDLRFDRSLLEKTLRDYQAEGIIHFAASIEVGESVENPAKYFENNFIGSFNLLEAARKAGVKKVVFSSSAAVYGQPERIPVKESDPTHPDSPYGETKLMVEKMLRWYAPAYGFSAIALRYFNAAGADLRGERGQDYPFPTHLITRACLFALGRMKKFAIFGDDYPTKDGTGVRDYVHVLDLVSAHLLALENVANKESFFDVFNVGTGRGYSVKEVIAMVEKVAKKKLKVPVVSRRPGDVAALVADSKKIQKELGWHPRYSDLETIVKSSYLWHRLHPHGY